MGEHLPTFILDWILPASVGLVIGSFLNVLIHRIPLKESIVFPGSRCPSCKTEIRWYDNIPVFSYLLLRGKCRKCGAKISPRYPLVELLTAILFVAARVTHGLGVGLFVRDWPLISILIAVTFIDLDHRIIPNVLSLPGTAFALATSFLDTHLGLEPLTTFGLFAPPESEALTAMIRSAEGAALGWGMFFGLAKSYELATGRAGLGGGDVKLLALIGAFLGPVGVVITVLVSSVLGSVVGISWALLTRKKNLMTAAIPYGPFLVVGGLYYYLFY